MLRKQSDGVALAQRGARACKQLALPVSGAIIVCEHRNVATRVRDHGSIVCFMAGGMAIAGYIAVAETSRE